MIDMILREISKIFEYILKFTEQHSRQIEQLIRKKKMEGSDIEVQIENQIIDTVVQLGRSTKDPKSMLNAATSLAHFTEVLNCNE